MFGLQKYADKIYKLKWMMTEAQRGVLKHLCRVTFKQVDDYLDILEGLEEVDFLSRKKKTKHTFKFYNLFSPFTSQYA